MSIRGPVSRLLDPERSRFSRATLTLLSLSAWINNTLAFLFWIFLQLNNLGVWAEANGFWFVVLLLFAPIFITLLGLFWQILSLPLVLLLAVIYWLWAETVGRLLGVLRAPAIKAQSASHEIYGYTKSGRKAHILIDGTDTLALCGRECEPQSEQGEWNQLPVCYACSARQRENRLYWARKLRERISESD